MMTEFDAQFIGVEGVFKLSVVKSIHLHDFIYWRTTESVGGDQVPILIRNYI